MTRKLEELFNLSQSEEKSEEFELPPETQEITETALNNLEKIENALPQVRGLETADIEMDELASLAQNSYKDLMDLGMQVDSRFSSEIFNVAGTMLGHAITAKTNKVSKKLKMIELQLKKAALDQKQNSKDKEIEATPLGEGKALDRNEILKALLDKKTDK
jgi:trimethylamine:corrinoid methyltransferase-like protein